MPSPPDRVPPPLRKLLDLDVAVTKKCVDTATKRFPALAGPNAESYMKMLEISCHGIPWFAITLIWIYLVRAADSRPIQVNLFLALLYDVVLIAVIKALTRRHRPPQPPSSSKMFFTHGPDKFSFPSGHASRAVFLALFSSSVTNLGSFLPIQILACTWAASVCASRVLMRRHHVLDVAVGIVLGFLEYAAVASVLWVGDDTAKWIGDSIAGAEDEFDGS